MDDPILDRIVRASGVDSLLDILSSRLSSSDLRTLLLEVARRRSSELTGPALLEQYQRDRFVQPADIDPRDYLKFAQAAWALLPDDFRAIELSPLAPLGASSVVATVSQNKVVTTMRTSEVVSDSTNVLAMEAALTRRVLLRDPDRRSESVFLSTIQRQVRAQNFAGSGARAHFGLLALVAAGRDNATGPFALSAGERLVRYAISVIGTLRPSDVIVLALTDLGIGTVALNTDIVEPLHARFAHLDVRFDDERTSGRGYYEGFCFKLFLESKNNLIEIGDGGPTSWTSHLLNDNKERCVIAGVGIDRVVA